MAAAVLRYVALEASSRSGTKLPGRARAGDVVEIVVRHPDGSTEAAALVPEVAEAVQRLVERVYAGAKVAVIEEDKEISPNDAATILGMSRPLVIRRMDAGDLPFRYEGAHRRAKLRDVLALKAQEQERQRAIDALAEMTETLMEEHGLS